MSKPFIKGGLCPQVLQDFIEWRDRPRCEEYRTQLAAHEGLLGGEGLGRRGIIWYCRSRHPLSSITYPISGEVTITPFNTLH